MTEDKKISLKNKMSSRVDKGESIKSKKKEQQMKSKKVKQLMKKRLIIRNLSFKVSENQLKEIFSKFGEVLDVTIPLNKEGRKRGFAFIRYKEGKSLIKAVKDMNFQKIDGRPIAIDYAIPKTKFQTVHHNDSSFLGKNTSSNETKIKVESLKDDGEDPKDESESDDEDDDNESVKAKYDSNSDDNIDNEDEDERKVKTFFKEFDGDKGVDISGGENSSEDSSDEDMDDDEKGSDHSDDNASNTSFQIPKKRQSNDLSEKKTVFIRNVSFKSDEEDLQEVMEEYGDFHYCLLCVDPTTDHPKGTAFVKFKEKESAEKLIQESEKEPGILLDGRKLLCSYAISREELSKRNDSDTVKDKRNLRLLKCGLIAHGSKEAEGVSKADMKKRFELEVAKKQTLRNVNFFISDKRLIIHNLPENITDRDLYSMFQKAAGKGASIKKARVMRDFKNTDAQGVPVSRGFGFVCFAEHEPALKALMELNNNPHIFSPKQRPIVEFSVENKVALLSRERKREKMKMLSKKRKEQTQTQENEMESYKSQSITKKPKKKKMKMDKILPFKSAEQKNEGSSGKSGEKSAKKKKKKKMDKILPFKRAEQKNEGSSEKSGEKSAKKKKKRFQKNKKGRISAEDRKNLSTLTNKYKTKLLNTFA